MKSRISPQKLLFIVVTSIILSIAAAFAGSTCASKLKISVNTGIGNILMWIFAALTLLFIILAIAGIVIKRKKAKTNIEEFVGGLAEKKNEIQKNVAAAERKLLGMKIRLIMFEILTWIYDFLVGFIIGMLMQRLFIIPAVFLFAITLSRYAYSNNRFAFAGYSGEADYPALYEIAYEAAKKNGVDNKIRILISSDCTASVALAGDTVSLVVGSILLSVLDRDEFFNVMLHEFAHIKKMNWNILTGSSRIENRIRGVRSTLFFGPLMIFYNVVDVPFIYEFVTYKMFSAIVAENDADRAFSEFGDVSKAASASTKIVLYTDFDREISKFLKNADYYRDEQPRQFIVASYIESFKRALTERWDFWKSIHEKEILAPLATHPLLRDRIENMGTSLSEVALTLPDNSSRSSDGEAAFRDDCVRAVAQCDRMISDRRKAGNDDYSEGRRKNYLEPLRRVEEWEKEGKPLTPDTLKQVCRDLFEIDRAQEAEEVCDRAIAEFNTEDERAHAYYLKGSALLENYDDSGIDLLYRSAETNSNYIDDVISAVGKYVYLMGLRDEADKFEAWSKGKLQEKKDKYSHLNGLSVRDNLVEEPLEGTMLQDLVSYFVSVGGDNIERIYLVRKVISEDFFTSYFIIEFAADADEAAKDKVMDAAFERLDTGYDWQFCLDVYGKEFEAALKKVKNSCVYERHN